MEIKHNVVGWFEIPVSYMERAVQFYETVLGYNLQREKLGTVDMAWFPWKENEVGSSGSLVNDPETCKPSKDGLLVYFTAFSGDLVNELSRAEAAGGKVVIPKKEISPEHGNFGVFLDTEGNRVALHSRE